MTVRRSLLLLLVSFSFTLLLSAHQAWASDAESLLRQYIAVWNGGDTSNLSSILAEDFVRHGNYGSVDSRDEFEELISGFRGFYRKMQIEIEGVVASESKAAMRWRFSGGYGDTAFEMNALNFSMYHFVDGLISQEWVFGNTVEFWTSMGYTIMPPGTKMIPPPVEASPNDDPSPPPIEARGVGTTSPWSDVRRSRKSGQLQVSTGLDCRLRLDGRDHGWLAADQTATLSADAGAHLLEASSRGGSIVFRESIELKKGKMARVAVQRPGRVIVNPRNRTTEDLTTGLMWQITDNGSDISQDRAAAHCGDLEQGGYTNWRLPSLFELENLYAPETAGSKRFHTVPGITLTGCCPWTTTTHGDFHWTFVFYNGLRYIKYRSIAKFSRALCVRNTWNSPGE